MFLFILAGLLVVSANAADTNLTGVAVRKISEGWTYCNQNTPLQMRCSENCENLEYCLNGRVISINCMEQTKKKYCDWETTSCKSEINVCYNRRDFCPHDGLFPDLSNCNRYVYCDGDDMTINECDYGTMWNYKTGLCEENITCQTYTKTTGCAGNNWNSIVPHTNPRWFVFCNFGRSFLAECPGRKYTFDRDIANCRFQCHHQDLWRNQAFADEWDPSIYYKCYKINGQWTTDTKNCKPGMRFDESKQICVRSSTTAATTTMTPVTPATPKTPAVLSSTTPATTTGI